QEPARLQRVEVEVPRGEVGPVRPFVSSMRQECHLTPAKLSKLEAGLLAAGKSPSEALDVGPLGVAPELSTGEVAFAVLRGNFRALLLKEAGTRLGEDPEELHDMRVATRRIRAALSVFREALPVRAARFNREWAWLADSLGRVRDLDVQTVELRAWAASL